MGEGLVVPGWVIVTYLVVQVALLWIGVIAIGRALEKSFADGYRLGEKHASKRATKGDTDA